MDEDYEQEYSSYDEPKYNNKDQANSPINRDLNYSKQTKSKDEGEDFYHNDLIATNTGHNAASYDTNDVETLVGINDNLKKELEMIVKTIENQYNKMKEDKRNEIENAFNDNQLVIEPDLHKKLSTNFHDSICKITNNSNVTAKEMQLRLAQGKVNKMRKEIAWMKQQINNAYEVDNILALENELKYNKQVIDKLVLHNKGLANVKKGQSVAMRKLNHDTDANQRLDNIKQEVEEYK